MTFGAFISAKRKELRLTLRETAKHLGIACGYLSDVEQSRRPAPEGDFVERISRYLDLSKTDHERLLDLAAKSRNRISADLPEYIMQMGCSSHPPFPMDTGWLEGIWRSCRRKPRWSAAYSRLI